MLIRLLEITEMRAEIPFFVTISTPGATYSQLSNLEAILNSRNYFWNENAFYEPMLVYDKKKVRRLDAEEGGMHATEVSSIDDEVACHSLIEPGVASKDWESSSFSRLQQKKGENIKDLQAQMALKTLKNARDITLVEMQQENYTSSKAVKWPSCNWWANNSNRWQVILGLKEKDQQVKFVHDFMDKKQTNQAYLGVDKVQMVFKWYP